MTELLRANLAVAANTAIVRTTGNESLITWPDHEGFTPFSPPGAFGTVAEYRRLLRGRQYTCVLDDGALLQLSFVFRRDVLLKHRLNFIPCPLLIEPDQGEGDDGVSLSELFDFYFLEELEIGKSLVGDDQPPNSYGRLRLRSPLRFDYDSDAAGSGHPQSHLHMLQEDVRVAVFGPLSIGHFVRFLFRHFYPTAFRTHAFLRDWPVRFESRCVTEADEKELFLECSS